MPATPTVFQGHSLARLAGPLRPRSALRDAGPSRIDLRQRAECDSSEFRRSAPRLDLRASARPIYSLACLFGHASRTAEIPTRSDALLISNPRTLGRRRACARAAAPFRARIPRIRASLISLGFFVCAFRNETRITSHAIRENRKRNEINDARYARSRKRASPRMLFENVIGIFLPAHDERRFLPRTFLSNKDAN